METKKQNPATKKGCCQGPDEGSCSYKMAYNKNTFIVNLSRDAGQSNYYELMTIMGSFKRVAVKHM